MSSFLAANQMAITQLAIKYCDTLVEDTGLRAQFFPGFDFNASANQGLSSTARDALMTPIVDSMLGNSLATQPEAIDVRAELNALTDRLLACSSTNTCDSNTTRNLAKANCAAVLGSAAVVVQ